MLVDEEINTKSKLIDYIKIEKNGRAYNEFDNDYCINQRIENMAGDNELYNGYNANFKIQKSELKYVMLSNDDIDDVDISNIREDEFNFDLDRAVYLEDQRERFSIVFPWIAAGAKMLVSLSKMLHYEGSSIKLPVSAEGEQYLICKKNQSSGKYDFNILKADENNEYYINDGEAVCVIKGDISGYKFAGIINKSKELMFKTPLGDINITRGIKKICSVANKLFRILFKKSSNTRGISENEINLKYIKTDSVFHNFYVFEN